jgi:NAD dependent epimerase/dehydratase
VSALAGRRVLVTGADGFIGSHLTERLVAEGARVRALCLYNSDGSHGWLDDASDEVADAIDFQLGDVRDPKRMEEVVAGVDVVFHLAALIAIPYSYQAPHSFVDTNVTGTLNVLEAALRAGVERVVQTSTSEVYGTPTRLPIDESHPLQGQSPYSATKIAADKLCEAYAASFELPVVVLRPFNTYGPRQSARAVIPTILGQLLAGIDPVHLGSVHPQRDFTYVDDTVDGFVRMATAPVEPGTTVQLGTGETISVGEVFETCCHLLGVEPELVTDDQRIRPEASEVQVLLSDPSLAADLLGWKPTTAYEEGLRATATWLEGRVDPRRARQYQR